MSDAPASYDFDLVTTGNPLVAAALRDLQRLNVLCDGDPDDAGAFDRLFALAIRADSSLTQALKSLESDMPRAGSAFIALRDDALAAMSEIKPLLCIEEGAAGVPAAAHLLRRVRGLLDGLPAKLAALEEMIGS